ncbi:S41 family peptidase [Marinifilum flexuosum]|uniref:Peptidase S41-like protein n=1 Tax=Marinifilum flexuosum TaxID=1117708 RepID=A0A419X825_9BACT|nr:S41 family peptidase [Marinifilum flexuosum]RKE03759.1 peptidase S41-like protein [Marinifilum flexuosum]
MILKRIVNFVKILGLLSFGIMIFYLISWSCTVSPAKSAYRYHKIDPNSLISKEKALKDLQNYYHAIRTAHPQPYRYTSDTEFRIAKDSLAKIINTHSGDSLKKVELYFLLRSLAAKTKDSHTIIFMVENEPISYFPYGVKIFNNRLYVVGNDSTSRPLPIGSEILSINDIACDKILSTLSNFESTALEHTKNNKIAKNFSFYLYYYYQIKDSVKLEVKSNGVKSNFKVNLMDRNPDFQTKNRIKPKYQFYQLGVNGDSIPVIDLNDFSDIDMDRFKKEVDLFFESHYSKDYLIIDLRDNGGGSEKYGRYVLGYLTNKRMKTYENYIWKMSEVARWQINQKKNRSFYNMKVPSVLWKFPIHKLHEYGNYIEDKLSMNNGELRNSGPSYFDPQKVSYPFRGGVLMLINHETASAAQDVAAIFKRNQLGVLIGSETKNSMSFGGNIWVDLELENSGIRYYMPMTYGVIDLSDSISGVRPDINVHYSFKEYSGNIDKEMKKAIELIEN